ncbi:MAG: transcription elongation factor GreA [Patescibacteria group bacterium]|nr:transcription elongation factor GreA [Patescibacteria group bacterium]
MDKYYLSKNRLEELKKELEELKSTKRIEIAEKLKHAKEYGDLSENSEYAEAREEQSRTEGRIAELEDILKRSVIIKKSTNATKTQIGSTITVKKGVQIIKYTITGAAEADPSQGRISNESPLGKAFLGKAVGEKAEAVIPSGKATYYILKIE